MQDRAFDPRTVVVLCLAICLATVAQAQGKKRRPQKVQPRQAGFRLVAPADLIYIPKRERPIPVDLFQVLSDGKKPQDGFFDVGGKPVAPVWTSSDTSVLQITTDRRTGKVVFTILGPGKTTVTVSVGRWSDGAELTVVESPFSLGVSRRTLVQDFGYPSKKYRSRSSVRAPIAPGFESLPQDCWVVQRHSLVVKAAPRYYGYEPEFWEYQQSPRCLLCISDGRVRAILTRPSQKGDATRLRTKGPAKPGRPGE